jgi:HEPN domain-containing protein
MSKESLARDAAGRLAQARDDLRAAHILMEGGASAQAAFWSQQAAEKAMKALWFGLDLDPWGHSVGRLIRDLPKRERAVFEPLLSEALALDKLYIPTRYPDALADLTPAEAYTREEAKTALDKATRIVTAVGEHIGTAD